MHLTLFLYRIWSVYFPKSFGEVEFNRKGGDRSLSFQIHFLSSYFYLPSPITVKSQTKPSLQRKSHKQSKYLSLSIKKHTNKLTNKAYFMVKKASACCSGRLCAATEIEPKVWAVKSLKTIGSLVVNYVPLEICTFCDETALHYLLHYTGLIVLQAIILHLPTVPLSSS